MADNSELERPVSVSRLSFPLQIVVLVVTTVVSVIGSQALATSAIRGEISDLRQAVAVMGARQEVRDDSYRGSITELKAEGVKQKDDLQKQIRALEYVIQEIKIDLARRR
jgi:hypothetical protein